MLNFPCGRFRIGYIIPEQGSDEIAENDLADKEEGEAVAMRAVRKSFGFLTIMALTFGMVASASIHYNS